MFRLQTIAVHLSLAAQALSIGCEYIGLDTFKEDLTGEIITQLDPLVEDSRFEIIDPHQCYWRFHVPPERKTTPANIRDFSEDFRSSRITQGSWTDTEATVAMTVDDPLNNQGRNSMLWLSEPVKAFHYAGLLRNGETGVQASLNKPLVIANILLPSGKDRVQSIIPPIYADQTDTQNAERMNAKNIGIIGLSGDVDPATDYAYAFTSRLAEGLKHRYPGDTKDDTPHPGSAPLPGWEEYGPKFRSGPWLKAERDNGECVVIDLRRLEEFFRNVSAQNYSEVCDFPRGAKRELESMMVPVSWAA